MFLHKEKNTNILNIIQEPVVGNVSIGISTDIGKRNSQQDVVMATDVRTSDHPEKVIAVLCDGMGGMDNGDVVAELCAKGIFKDFNSSEDIENYPVFLNSEIDKFDDIVFDRKDDNGRNICSGTTLLCCIVDGGDAYWASVGDSRIYLIRKDEIVQISKDHNYMLQLSQMVKEGLMSQQQADNDVHKDSLISYIGMGGVKLKDISNASFKLESGDIILMCSDGVYRALSDENMLNIISDGSEDIQAACDKLISEIALRNLPYQDNSSVIALKYM